MKRVDSLKPGDVFTKNKELFLVLKGRDEFDRVRALDDSLQLGVFEGWELVEQVSTPDLTTAAVAGLLAMAPAPTPSAAQLLTVDPGPRLGLVSRLRTIAKNAASLWGAPWRKGL